MTDPMPGWSRHPVYGEILDLVAGDGAALTVTRHGAQAIRWRSADGVERLYLSRRAEYGKRAAIRGGVPVIFPQFAAEGPLPKHGFARNRPWQLVAVDSPASGSVSASFRLDDDAETRTIWPFRFRADLRMTIGGSQLEIELRIGNSGEVPLSFTAALHSYLSVTDVANVRIGGLDRLHYRDSAAGGIAGTQKSADLAIAGEVDRIYFDAPAVLELRNGVRGLRIESAGFRDAVVWNPGETKAAALKDLDREGWRHFVCIESAAIGMPPILAAGAQWIGMQRLIAV